MPTPPIKKEQRHFKVVDLIVNKALYSTSFKNKTSKTRKTKAYRTIIIENTFKATCKNYNFFSSVSYQLHKSWHTNKKNINNSTEMKHLILSITYYFESVWKIYVCIETCELWCVNCYLLLKASKWA